MRKQIYSVAVAVAFAIPSLASADVETQTIDETKVVVTYDLQEASTDLGREQLEREIRKAADQVCGPRNLREAGSLKAVMDNRTCYRNALASAMKSVETGSVAVVTSN